MKNFMFVVVILGLFSFMAHAEDLLPSDDPNLAISPPDKMEAVAQTETCCNNKSIKSNSFATSTPGMNGVLLPTGYQKPASQSGATSSEQ